MVRRILLIIITLNYHCASAQLRSSLWLMGYDCCFPNFSGINLDFRTGNLQINAVTRQMDFRETNGIAMNDQGDLLFYSNGIYIANTLDDTMLNGSGLNPSDFTSAHTDGLTLPQANLIIPIPGDTNRYYLFHETVDDRFASYCSFYLYYSVIDMSLDNGLGAVTSKNQILLNDSLIVGRITSVKHANGRDWWVIAPRFRNGMMYKFLVTSYGISGPFIQNMVTSRDNYLGQDVFSVNGDKFAYYEPFGDLDIWDFDRCTGNFSNLIHVDINDSAAGGGVAFSPSGRFLYVSSMNYIYQFDMDAPDVVASQTTVGLYDGFLSHNFPANFYLSALAPDGKIYVNCGNSTLDIHVINYPDSLGLSCDFCQHCIHLPAFNAFTIPNFPNYYLGPVVGSVCDTVTTSITDFPSFNDALLFPNPVQELMYVSIQQSDLIVSAVVTDGKGIESTINYKQLNGYLEFDTGYLKAGVYSITILSEKGVISKKFIKM